jgi:hypothetical protein
LPDGLFLRPKIPFWVYSGMANVGIFYSHWVYFTSIWYDLWPFGIICGHLVYFVVIWYILEWQMLVYFTAIGYILHPFGMIYGHLV